MHLEVSLFLIPQFTALQRRAKKKRRKRSTRKRRRNAVRRRHLAARQIRQLVAAKERKSIEEDLPIRPRRFLKAVLLVLMNSQYPSDETCRVSEMDRGTIILARKALRGFRRKPSPILLQPLTLGPTDRHPQKGKAATASRTSPRLETMEAPSIRPSMPTCEGATVTHPLPGLAFQA